MTLSPTPNMSLLKPEPGVTPGQDWADMLNTIIDQLDAHDHSSGKGVKITPSAIDINADLGFGGYKAAGLKETQFNDQAAALSGASNARGLHSFNGNLYWVNGSGASVPITSGTAVVSSITNAFATSTPGAYPYTVSVADAQKVLLFDTSAARTLNLPAATTVVMFIVKDITGSSDTNAITVVPNGTDTIDGVNANRTLADGFGSWLFISDGVSGWAFMSLPNQSVPPGVIEMYGAATAPPGYLLCNGAAVSRTTYSRLFAKISTTFGAGDGVTTFNVPDMRGRFPIGKAAAGTGSTLGGSGGTIDHTHSVPAHYHSLGAGADLAIGASGAHVHSIDHDHGAVTSGAESGHTHSIDHNHAAVTSAGSGALSTDSQGAHTHFIINNDLVSGGSAIAPSTTNWIAKTFDAVNDFSVDLRASGATADRGLTSSNGAHTHSIADHTHSVDLPNFTGTSGASSGHTHSVDLPNFTGSAGSATHTHAVGDFSGRVGLVTGGVDGNAAMTSGTANPPFLSVNFIIKT